MNFSPGTGIASTSILVICCTAPPPTNNHGSSTWWLHAIDVFALGWETHYVKTCPLIIRIFYLG